ncbi:flavin reductase family protein [Chitinophaga defluvii]|uniref:Iron-sulfur cluster-binding domain-containing protein n=1 Tax=Chitinophaga defluvii TaxID=3163343 RepID=A0ABV2T9K1_9BACT
MADLFLQLRIIKVIKEAPGTLTYQLENTTAQPVVYQPGQFLTFVIQLHGTEYRRSYSFSSTPGIDPYMSVTVREKENGEISRHILRTWKAGDIITTLLPSGRFTLDNIARQPRDIFLFAAGSGITPLFSLLKHLLYREPTAQIILVYSSTDIARTIFYEQIQQLQEKFGAQLTCLYYFSNEPLPSNPYRRLSNILLEPMVRAQMQHNPADAQFFLCGPPDYMRMITLTLIFMGFTQEQLHKENFVVNTDARIAKTPVPKDSTPRQVRIHFHQQEHLLHIPGNQNILSSAQQQGLALPYSCKGGVCGSCTAKCTEGKVWMAVNEVLTDKEITQGFILTCVGYVTSEQATIEL